MLQGLELISCVNATTCLNPKPKVVTGVNGASANIFLDNLAYREFLYSHFNVSLVDMETAAAALVPSIFCSLWYLLCIFLSALHFSFCSVSWFCALHFMTLLTVLSGSSFRMFQLVLSCLFTSRLLILCAGLLRGWYSIHRLPITVRSSRRGYWSQSNIHFWWSCSRQCRLVCY